MRIIGNTLPDLSLCWPRLPPGSYSDAVAMDDWIFGLTPPYGERVMALKPKNPERGDRDNGRTGHCPSVLSSRWRQKSHGKTGGGDQKDG